MTFMIDSFLYELEQANKKHGAYCCCGDGYLAIREEFKELEAEFWHQHNKWNYLKIEEESLHLAVTAFKMAELARKKYEASKL